MFIFYVRPEWHLLFGDVSSTAPCDRLIFSSWRNRVSVRTPQYRLDHRGRLYDPQKDPGQRTDISAAQPELTRRLKQAVQDWIGEQLKFQERARLICDELF